MSALLQQFKTLPRAAQWLAYLAVVLLVFFGIIKPLWGLSDTVGGDASKLETAIARHNDLSSADSGDGGYIASTQAVFGTPMMPKAGGLKPEDFTRVVDGILESHQITDRNVNERPKTPMASLKPEYKTLLGVTGIDRLTLEVTFEARPSDVAAILADLERAPEVAAISRVRIDHNNSRNGDIEEVVRTTIIAEAWLAASGTPAAPTSTGEVIP